MINGLDHIMASFVDEGKLYDSEAFSYDKNGNRTRLEQNGDIYTYNFGVLYGTGMPVPYNLPLQWTLKFLELNMISVKTKSTRGK